MNPNSATLEKELEAQSIALSHDPNVGPMLDTDASPVPRRKPGALARHARKCKICAHKDREDIEDDFLHWHRCLDISIDYQIRDVRAVYRHAHATGLYELRNKNVRHAVAHLAENAEAVRCSGTVVLAAIRALSLIDESGVWHEPVRHNIIEHRRPPANPLPAKRASADRESHAENRATSHPSPAPEPAPVAAENTGFFNRYLPRLKNAVTPTKQSGDLPSNRHFFAPSHDPKNHHSAASTGTRAQLPLESVSALPLSHPTQTQPREASPASAPPEHTHPLRWSPE